MSGPLFWPIIGAIIGAHFGAGDASRLAFRQKFLRLGNRFGKPDPLDFDIWRKGACHAGWQRLSSITNTPRSLLRRISRPKAWRSFSRVWRSVQASRPCHLARAENRISLRGHGIRSNTMSRSAAPGTSMPSRTASVPRRQLSGSSRNMASRVCKFIWSICWA